MARYYLRRLHETDAKRDWMSEAPNYGNVAYKDFMQIVNACSKKMSGLNHPHR